jgi:outer membrane protein OmpA-like peptidoglycan-associated protein
MKSILSLTAILLLTILGHHTHAQERDLDNLDHKKKHDVAHSMLEKGSYYNAINHLQELVKENPKNKKYLTKLADAYFMSRDYVNAEIWYHKAVEMDGKITTTSLYKLAESQKYNAKYADAKANFKLFFDSKYKDSRGEKYKTYAENEIESCEFALQHVNDTVKTDIKHLGDTINSAYTDFSPSMLDDSTLVFASLQADSVLTYGHDEVHFNHTKLYKSQLHGEEWTHPEQIDKVNTLFENNANGSLSSDGKRFYFSRCYENLSHKMICNIYVSEIDEKGNFGKPKKLPANINKGGHNNTQPVVAKHKLDKGGEQEVLYFVSDRTGGKGGLDIWYAAMLPEGKFKNPINLGKDINTVRDEITPYYDSLSGNLYFSSNYHYGFGGYDIFRSKGQMITWSKAYNVGIPYNSNVDDTYYIFNKKQNKGFFVSNRIGGINLKSPTCCDDIYGYTQTKPLLLVAHTYDKASKALIQSAKEIIFNQSSGKQNDTIKLYDNIEGQYLYSKLIAKEIYPANRNNGYAVSSIDSGKVIENAYFTIDEYGEVKNSQLLYSKDSISATRIEDSRFDIISINIFIQKDANKTPLVIAQKVFDEKEKYFTNNNLKDSITVVKNTLVDSVSIAKNKVTNTLSDEQIVTKNTLNNTQSIAKKTNKISDVKQLATTNIQDTTSNLKSTTVNETKPKVEANATKLKAVTKINKLKNVKRAVVTHDIASEAETISNTSNIDSVITYTNALSSEKNVYKEELHDIKLVVHFDFNEVSYINSHKKTLDSVADFLIRNPQVVLHVEAHTDNVGSEQYNKDLSYKRSKTIVAYFAHLGISRDRVIPKWFGENSPMLPNQNPDGTDNEHNRLKNRRAELKFYNYKKKPKTKKK